MAAARALRERRARGKQSKGATWAAGRGSSRPRSAELAGARRRAAQRVAHKARVGGNVGRVAARHQRTITRRTLWPAMGAHTQSFGRRCRLMG